MGFEVLCCTRFTEYSDPMRHTSIFILGIFAPTLVMGITRHVYETDGAPGIQDSIDVSSPYDVILVHPGTYYVGDVSYLGIRMRDARILRSAEGAESCVLTGLSNSGVDTANHVIYCNFGDLSPHEAVIRGFTIRDGGSASRYEFGGGIYCNMSSPLIDSCIITNNSAYYGGGLFLQYSSSALKHNTITDNCATCAAGGLYVCWSSPVIEHNIIKSNVSDDHGGGLYIYASSSPTVRHNEIVGNVARCGGGFYLESSTCSTISCNTVAGNHASYYGGGFYVHRSSPLIVGNVITGNSTQYGCGGGVFACDDFSFPVFKFCTITSNRSKRGGAFFNVDAGKVFVDSSLVVDNGSTSADAGSGFLSVTADADTVSVSHSHVYYNTFQPDTEICNYSTIAIPLEHNFWWRTTDTEIEGLMNGPNEHTPWENDFIPGVPGEPVSVDSICNYSSSYSSVADSLENDPDTLYLRIYGEDRNPGFREAAVAIVKSSVYPGGVAVALVETDTNSGVYEGKAIVTVATGTDSVRIDDIRNTIKANDGPTRITIAANMDTSKQFVVWYRCGQAVEDTRTRSGISLHAQPNPFARRTVIRYQLVADSKVLLRVYDISGRLTQTLVDGNEQAGDHRVNWNIRAEKPGVYFVRLTVDGTDRSHKNVTEIGKLILVR